MAEQATSTRSEPAAGADAGVSELREELARNREEVLRLRDLLIARDAELGAARGRLAEQEAQVGKLLNLAAQMRALVPTFLWKAAVKLLRWLRS
jgi:hypothetical protein